MEIRRTRLRSQAAVKNDSSTVFVPVDGETLQPRSDVVEVEVEEEHDRGLPIVRGVSKRKRDPRGAGRTLQQKLESQEGSVSVFVHENANDESEDEGKRSERYESSRSPREPAFSRPAAVVIMPEEQAVMKQLDKRRESSRLRVKPSKFREGFLLSTIKSKGEGKGADDGTPSLEIILPMDAHNATPRGQPPDFNPRGSSARPSESDIESSLERPSQVSAGKNKFKISHKLGSAKATERQASAADSSSSPKKGFDDQELKAALAVVKRVMQIKSADPFNDPVDPVALGIPDYLDVIDEPMDLGTIRELLERGKKYETAQDVFADVQLVWSNCRSYNQEGDPIMDILKIAETCFNKHWNAAGLPVFGSGAKVQKAQMKEESDKVEAGDRQGVSSEQREREESKKRKSKDSKVVAKLNLQKIVHHDTPNLRLKTKRSASVEQVMAESRAREDKLEVDNIGITKEESNPSQGYADNEDVDEVDEVDEVEVGETLQNTVEEGLHTPEEIEDTEAGGLAIEKEVDAIKESEEGQAAVDMLVDQEAKTPVQDKDLSVRGSASNKRRTFGTVHHKPDCSCVVCVGRRRKLARQEREGVEGKTDKKEHAKLPSPVVQEGVQATKAHVSKIRRSPKPPQLLEPVIHGATLSVETEIVEPGRPDSQTGNASEMEAIGEGVRYYPANYELPLRKVNPSLLHLSRALFGNHHNTVWRRHHSMSCRWPPSTSKSSMLEAVQFLTFQ